MTYGELIVKWENGETTESEEIGLFNRLLLTGEVWNLPGTFGRRCIQLIKEDKIPFRE